MARLMWLLGIGGLLLAGNSTSQTSRAEPAIEFGASESEEAPNTLEGVLRLRPKFHYRYYIEGFGDG